MVASPNVMVLCPVRRSVGRRWKGQERPSRACGTDRWDPGDARPRTDGEVEVRGRKDGTEMGTKRLNERYGLDSVRSSVGS